AEHLAVFPRSRVARGRRRERDQCDARRLSRLRYAWRDQRARCGRADGLLAAAAISAPARKRANSAPAKRHAVRDDGPRAAEPLVGYAGGISDGAGSARPLAAAHRRTDRRVSVPAWP